MLLGMLCAVRSARTTEQQVSGRRGLSVAEVRLERICASASLRVSSRVKFDVVGKALSKACLT